MRNLKLLSGLCVGGLILVMLCLFTTRVSAQDGIDLPAIQIERLPDGTSSFTDFEYGYSYEVPPGWYPVGFPASGDEINQFNQIIDEKQLPIDKELIPSIPAEAVRFFVFDLERTHYANDSQIIIGGPYTSVLKIVPEGALIPFLELIKTCGYIKNVDSMEISGQLVGFAEFSDSGEEAPNYGGKMLLFIREGKIFGIVSMSTPDLTSNAISIIDQILGSLDFFEPPA